ncbi:hypothetical protein PV08_10201 [Exophiala spinifera]|uniref:Uncharacterized protein n=1 Tax=Exophiala spinifera TaxID=91928 RepID=A0A0D1ZD29_9EURO|nr:uncharacterized protein PV08_10201 [Exophiala spinifera]KIW10902.1 hypothetical protein PV08_10201 [Exophiala spinifera]
MTSPVHARSLSSLGALLSNPPQYPRNPTHQAHDPLVLYIVRVPGSKDVFLTPLKPPTKASISIEAVQSSLYFLHVERPEDEDLRQSLEATKVASTGPANVSPIARKPLPETPYANYPPSRRPLTPPKSYPHYQPPSPGSQDGSQADRYVARGSNLRLSGMETTQNGGMLRKPVGARPMPALPALDTSFRPREQENLGRQESVRSVTRKPVQSASSDHSDWLTSLPPNANGFGPSRSPTKSPVNESKSPADDQTRIILIRRDPASGSQWNVGSLFQRNTILRDNRLGRFDIELNSPGYTKFAKLESPTGHCFNRKVDYVLLPNNESGVKARHRSNSSEFFANSAYANSKKPRHAYSFNSPWQGTCSFTNGLDGKSLRCRHVLPTMNSSMIPAPVDVAELRLNLAWSILGAKDTNKQTVDVTQLPVHTSVGRPPVPKNKEQWRRSIQVLTHKAKTQLSHSDRSGEFPTLAQTKRDSILEERSSDNGRMNLDLGREKAGGGFKGHSAKLGKLIIQDEGLKMCDLVVAACMGVWWQHYTNESAS